jgi:arylsulfatase A-like enzyme
MKRVLAKIITVIGVLLAAGAFGAGWELLLNNYLHLTEPLAGWYWLWSFLHRAKFYALLAVAAAAVTSLAATILWVVRRRRRTDGEADRSLTRVAYAGAFAAPLAATPLWIILATARLELPDWAVFVIDPAWVIVTFAATYGIYRLAGKWRRAGRYVVRALAAVGYAAVAVYLVAGAISAATRPAAAPGLPDVVIITIDAFRADKMGPREDGSSLTPNIDRFAKDAYVFNNCRSHASWTSPSLGSLHTGQFPMVHYTTAHRPLGTSQPTLAEIMRDAGYDTRAVVANRLLHRSSGMARGFDDYLYWDQNKFVRATGYYETYFYYLENRIFEKRNTRVGVKDNHTTVITDRLVPILSETRDRPLFLWTHYLDPHCPYSPPKKYVAPEDRRYIDKFAHGDKKHADVLERMYDGEVRYVDDELGRVFAVVPENALVIISSDHGEEFWEHGGYDHGKTLYEEVIRVPLVVRYPEKEAAVSEAPAGLVDFAPSVLTYLGMDVPPSMQGRDLHAAAEEKEAPPAFAGSSMLKGQRRYCVNYKGRKLIIGHWDDWPKAEYYNLVTDPGEQDPIGLFDPSRVKLEALLKGWMEGNIEFAKQFERAGVSTAVRDQMRAVGYID